MAKEEKRKFKTEYIPVYISSAILILFLCLLVLTINYEGDTKETEKGDLTNAVNEDLSITKNESKCNQEELNELLNLANNISGDYQSASKLEPIEITEDNEDYYEEMDGVETYRFIEIIIKGIQDGVYVQISNDFNSDVVTIKTANLDENGEYRYEAPNMDQKITYTVDIYADKYSCSGEILRKIGFDTKIYNTKSDMLACLMYPKYEGCVTFVDKPFSFDEFNKGLELYKKNNKNYEAEANANILNAFGNTNTFTADNVPDKDNPKKETKFTEVLKKIKDNLDLIIIAISTIGIGILVVVLIMFIRRHRI